MKHYVASHLKDMNRLTVYNLISQTEEISKADITRITGISPPTVIKIMNFLLEKGFVTEAGEGSSALGRKPQMLRLNENKLLAVGVIFEGDYIRVGIVNLSGKILKASITRTEFSLEKSFNILPKIIDDLIAEAQISQDEIVGIGLGVPGSYDLQQHILSNAPLVGVSLPMNIQKLEDDLAKRYHVPVVVDNDVNMDALGEYRALGLKSDDFIYISMGTGIGASIILNGKLRRGCTYQCGEIGYMTLTDDYVAGKSNPGWLEQTVNLRTLKEKFGFDPYASNTENIKPIIDYIASPIALCIKNMVTVLDCNKVSIGGIIAESIGTDLIDAISERMRRLSIQDVTVSPLVCTDPGVVGASLCLLDRVVRDVLME